MKPRTIGIILLGAAGLLAVVVTFRHGRNRAAQENPTVTAAAAQPDKIPGVSASAARSSIEEQKLEPGSTDPMWALAEKQSYDCPEVTTISEASLSLPQRQLALQILSVKLSAASVEELMAYIGSPMPLEVSMLERERALRNDIFNVLRANWPDRRGLIENFSQVVTDRSQDPGLRDYAVQHVVSLLNAGGNEEMKAGLNTLAYALNTTEGTLAGTALIGLMHMAESRDVGLPVEENLLRVLRDDRYGRSTRVTALALCSKYSLISEHAISIAESWAADPLASVPQQLVSAKYLEISKLQ